MMSATTRRAASVRDSGGCPKVAGSPCTSTRSTKASFRTVSEPSGSACVAAAAVLDICCTESTNRADRIDVPAGIPAIGPGRRDRLPQGLPKTQRDLPLGIGRTDHCRGGGRDIRVLGRTPAAGDQHTAGEHEQRGFPDRHPVAGRWAAARSDGVDHRRTPVLWWWWGRARRHVPTTGRLGYWIPVGRPQFLPASRHIVTMCFSSVTSHALKKSACML